MVVLGISVVFRFFSFRWAVKRIIRIARPVIMVAVLYRSPVQACPRLGKSLFADAAVCPVGPVGTAKTQMVGIVYCCCNVDGMPLGGIWSENGIQGPRERLDSGPFSPRVNFPENSLSGVP